MTVTVEPEPPKARVSHGGSDGGDIDNGRRRYGGDDDGDGQDRNAPEETEAPESHAVLGMFIFIVSEFVFFAALALVFFLARGSQSTWPPPGQPRLPMALTGLNSIVLFASGYTMYLARKTIRRGNMQALKKWLFVTSGLGVSFLAIQGVEWIRLIRFGFEAAGNLYAATFYVIIGAHALHVLVAVGVILFVWQRALADRYSAAQHTGVILCQMFWLFVVFIWPLLYAVVYLI